MWTIAIAGGLYYMALSGLLPHALDEEILIVFGFPAAIGGYIMACVTFGTLVTIYMLWRTHKRKR
jgi:hypothetical protein